MDTFLIKNNNKYHIKTHKSRCPTIDYLTVLFARKMGLYIQKKEKMQQYSSKDIPLNTPNFTHKRKNLLENLKKTIIHL